MKVVIALVLSLLSGSASAQGMGGMFPGPGTAHSVGATYQGPGDVISGALYFGSCARAYNAAYANGTNALCDLVDSAAPTTVICTLRVLTTGFVDLVGTYCTGGLTPSAKCAAATGGVCNVSKVTNQVSPGTNDSTATTAATQGQLAFSAINSLPAIQCSGTSNLITPTINQNQPFSAMAVWRRTSGTARGPAIGAGGGTVLILGAGNVANFFRIGGASQVEVTGAVENTFHALSGAFNSASSAYNIDGTDVITQNFGATNFANGLRFCSDSTNFLTGQVMEGMLYPGAWSPTDRGNQNSNAHGTNGYNF